MLVGVLEVGTRVKNQPAPPWANFQALSEPDRDPARPWLELLADEVPPRVLTARAPHLLVWSSLWTRRLDAHVRFDLRAGAHGSGTPLRWTLLVDHPAPDAALVGHLCKRVNQLVNAGLRYSLGQ